MTDTTHAGCNRADPGTGRISATHHQLRSFGVVAIGMRKGAHQGQSVRQGSQLSERASNVDPRNACLQGSGDAPVVRRCAHFGIKCLDLARPARQKQQDH